MARVGMEQELNPTRPDESHHEQNSTRTGHGSFEPESRSEISSHSHPFAKQGNRSHDRPWILAMQQEQLVAVKQVVALGTNNGLRRTGYHSALHPCRT